MSNDLYKVTLKGYSTGKGEYYVEKDFAELFKMELTKAKEMFNSLPITIKESISLEEANQYKAAIDKTGAVCEVENMKYNFDGLSLE